MFCVDPQAWVKAIPTIPTAALLDLYVEFALVDYSSEIPENVRTRFAMVTVKIRKELLSRLKEGIE